MDELTPRETSRTPARDAAVRHRPTPRPVEPGATASVFVYAWLLAAVTAAIFLAAGPAQGSLGIFLAGAGVVLTFFPARVQVEWPLWLAVGGLLAAGSVSFLPARWFATPSWREHLAAIPAIHLPSTVTPVPWETGFWLAVLGVTCLTGLFLLGHPVRSRAVFGVAAAAVLVCGAYAALSIYAKQTGWHYPFAGDATFGFFPNRNHTATFLVTGSIVALGVLTISLREHRWLLTVLVGAGMAACVAGLFFYSGSRGGIVFLVVGTLIWVAGLGGTHRNVPLVVSVLALVAAAGVLFVVSGGEARARLLGTKAAKDPGTTTQILASTEQTSTNARPGDDHDTPLDFRVLIYRDTADLIKDAPVSGTGLGAFPPVFALYRRASLLGSVALHPESDWLMLTAEAGVPALFCALVAGGLLLLRLRGANQHPFWPLRWACVAAAATALLHGTVDVPAHRVALGWWILLLTALGFQSGRSRAERSPWPQRGLFVLGGLGALALGVQLIRAEWFGAQALTPFATGQAEKEILALFNRQDQVGALERAQAAVLASPMTARLYYQLGIMLLHFEDTDAAVDDAFRAQRALNPIWPTVPLIQGDAWITIDPKRTVALWLQALDLRGRIDHVPPGDEENADAFFRTLIVRAAPWPAVERELATAAGRSPGFMLAWIDGAPPTIVREQLPSISGQKPLLDRFSAAQREKFLVSWYARGDRNELARFLAENSEWQAAAWPVRLREQLDGHQYESAVRETATRYKVSLDLPTPAGAEDGHPAVEPQTNDPVRLFEAFWNEGNPVSARRVLDDAEKAADQTTVNPEVWRLTAALSVRDGAWPEAWQSLRTYLRSINQGDALP